MTSTDPGQGREHLAVSDQATAVREAAVATVRRHGAEDVLPQLGLEAS